MPPRAAAASETATEAADDWDCHRWWRGWRWWDGGRLRPPLEAAPALLILPPSSSASWCWSDEGSVRLGGDRSDRGIAGVGGIGFLISSDERRPCRSIHVQISTRTVLVLGSSSSSDNGRGTGRHRHRRRLRRRGPQVLMAHPAVRNLSRLRITVLVTDLGMSIDRLVGWLVGWRTWMARMARQGVTRAFKRHGGRVADLRPTHVQRNGVPQPARG